MFYPRRTLKMNDSDRTACRFKFIMIRLLLLVALAREKTNLSRETIPARVSAPYLALASVEGPFNSL